MGSGWGGVRACAGFEWQDPDKVKRPNGNSHSMATETWKQGFACVARCLVWCCHAGFLPEFGNYRDRKGDDRDRGEESKGYSASSLHLKKTKPSCLWTRLSFQTPKPWQNRDSSRPAAVSHADRGCWEGGSVKLLLSLFIWDSAHKHKAGKKTHTHAKRDLLI